MGPQSKKQEASEELSLSKDDIFRIKLTGKKKYHLYTIDMSSETNKEIQEF